MFATFVPNLCANSRRIAQIRLILWVLLKVFIIPFSIHKVTNEVEDYLLTCKAEARSLHETIQDDTAAKTQAQQ